MGGADAVRRLVHRFYELMDELPEAYAVRRLHPESLAGSEETLFRSSAAGSGGPPLYIQERGPSAAAHAPLSVPHRRHRARPVAAVHAPRAGRAGARPRSCAPPCATPSTAWPST